MDPIERLSLQQDIDYYGFEALPQPLGVELIEIEGTSLIEIKTPTKDALFNWWE
ncbi:hypothetical protein [Tepidibacter hydrothermalis]|uniref:Uncharacterized protein n=1 Tax=Tepidibacter hydrothermalis TaxID=3036126 RepID=A0ABY8EAD7_9FIRM|nr:hypothetical protein [Tepidibacter hydrothermalis]WFD09766.1 hypothetical protein P4S50_15415 [Tepidibacter hydrothermalis]